MKDFLKIRDTDEAFDSIRKVGRIGLPTLVADGKVIHDVTKDVIEFLKSN